MNRDEVVRVLANRMEHAAMLAKEHAQAGRTHFADTWYGREDEIIQVAELLEVDQDVNDELYHREGGPE